MTPAGVVLDHTALLALGSGHRLLSALVAEAHAAASRYVYVPAVCLVAAIASRPALADHVGMLPALRVVDLDYPAASAVGGFVAAGVDWRAAHAIDTARPSAEWPTGLPLMTLTPEPYAGWGIAVVSVT